MKVEQRIWTGEGWTVVRSSGPFVPQLALAFAAPDHVERVAHELKKSDPGVPVVSCSTAGEILGNRVQDGTAVVTIIALEHGHIEVVTSPIGKHDDCRAIGASLAKQLSRARLQHVLVLAGGMHVDGSGLVVGLTSQLPTGVSVTGGLAADGNRFAKTAVWVGTSGPDNIAAIGFYGERLVVGCASVGGWDKFGPEREITRASGKVLHELDGKPALDLYKRYLGDDADALPSSGLAFPLAIREAHGDESIVRTLLSVDEVARTLTFAGDVPTGFRARLMSGNVERLVGGASDAAKSSQVPLAGRPAEFALLISCVGRRLVLGQRIEEEVEAVEHELGGAAMAGFYSYGEIGPARSTARCELHNQTMTVTTFSEL